MARSPWIEEGVTPRTVTEWRPSAPALSQNAALDQSPSTTMAPGVRYPWRSMVKTVSGSPPGVAPSSMPTFTPNALRTASVRPIYGRLSISPVTAIWVSPSSKGAASNSPEMYCELTFPGSSKRPARMRPEVRRGSPVAPWNVQPAAMSSSVSGAMGRSPSRGEPTKVASAPRAQATGSMKRSVEPDSPQSRVAPARARKMPCSRLLSTGWISKPPSMGSILAPIAVRQRMVASISAHVVSQATRVTPFARAAAMMMRCAIDLDEMAGTVPERGLGLILASMRPPRRRSRRTAPGCRQGPPRGCA